MDGSNIQHFYEKLDRALKRLGIVLVDDYEEVKKGVPAPVVALVRKLLFNTSTIVMKYMLLRGCPSHVQDKKVIISLFDLLRETVKYSPPISIEQFFASGFGQHKIVILTKLSEYVAHIDRMAGRSGNKTAFVVHNEVLQAMHQQEKDTQEMSSSAAVAATADGDEDEEEEGGRGRKGENAHGTTPRKQGEELSANNVHTTPNHNNHSHNTPLTTPNNNNNTNNHVRSPRTASASRTQPSSSSSSSSSNINHTPPSSSSTTPTTTTTMGQRRSLSSQRAAMRSSSQHNLLHNNHQNKDTMSSHFSAENVPQLDGQEKSVSVDMSLYVLKSDVQQLVEEQLQQKLQQTVAEISEKYDFVINKLVSAVDAEFTLLGNRIKMLENALGQGSNEGENGVEGDEDGRVMVAEEAVEER